ncbi:unnamed protein product [Ilex paraguariensis]|uniref:Fungal lipase-type domain-containing protein n=1 Tax=Ilex paraguariensis TaxID=185542 RepID=A0ABC8UPV2_9AQUA
MDSLFLKAGIHGVTSAIPVAGGALDVRTTSAHLSAAVGHSATPAANAISVDKPSVSLSTPPQRTAPWGFSFRYPLRSLWPGGRNRYDAIALDDAVVVDEKEEKKEGVIEGESGNDGQNGNWVSKILHVRALWKDEGQSGGEGLGEKEEETGVVNDNENDLGSSECYGGGGDEECNVCTVDDDDKIEFNRGSFSKLLRRVSLAEARLYAQMSYLGNLAYSIPQIKPGNLLKYHGLRFITSSLEKKQQVLKAEKEKAEADVQEAEGSPKEPADRKEGKTTSGNRVSVTTAYQIAASAASYLHAHTTSVLPFTSFKPKSIKDPPEGESGTNDNVCMMDAKVASLMATTDSVTAVVAAKEEVKQAVADDLNSTRSSPCEWFVCDDDQSGTRFFVIQGSESLASWQANLLFEPVQFEGLDVIVHRGIYEAAKGIYEQMLPEVRAHLRFHGDRATFRFTGHSLGGSLSLLVNLMLLIRGEVLPSSLLPVITFGAPSIMCGGDRLLRELGLPQGHIKAVTMHRDIVPRAFSCHYPNHVAELLKAVNRNFRGHPCLNNQRLLYAPMGEFLILQPDEKLSPNHDLLPSGSGLYLLRCPVSDASEAEKQVRAAQAVFLNSPHPLEILSDRSAYGSGGTIQRDHDMNSYWKSVRSVVRQELIRRRKARREHRRKFWWPLVARSIDAGNSIMGRSPVSANMGQGQFNFSGVLQTGRESLNRFSRLVASQHMHLLVVLLFPARLLIVGAYSVINFR